MLRRVTRTTQGIFPIDTEGTVVAYSSPEEGGWSYAVGEWTAAHTKDILAALSTTEGASFFLCGPWQVDDEGSVYDFDSHEVSPGDTWDTFKREHREFMRDLEEDQRSWRQETAREEGMLNGIDSYNDWMGY